MRGERRARRFKIVVERTESALSEVGIGELDVSERHLYRVVLPPILDAIPFDLVLPGRDGHGIADRRREVGVASVYLRVRRRRRGIPRADTGTGPCPRLCAGERFPRNKSRYAAARDARPELR